MSEERYTVVLGASSGVGASIIRAASRHGMNTFGIHRGNYPESADALSREVEGNGQKPVWHVGDAGTYEAAQAGADMLLEVGGKGCVSLFVHSIANASYGRFASLDRAQFHHKQFEKTFDSMAHSFVYWTQALLQRELLEPSAMLLGLTNPIPQNLADGFGMICASKAALEMYIKYLAMELGPQGYRVNLLNFGLVETTAVRRAFSDRDWQMVTDLVSSIAPMRRIQTCDEVAEFIMASLLRPEARYLNGATIDYTGAQAQSLLDLVFSYRKYGITKQLEEQS